MTKTFSFLFALILFFKFSFLLTPELYAKILQKLTISQSITQLQALPFRNVYSPTNDGMYADYLNCGTNKHKPCIASQRKWHSQFISIDRCF